MSSQMMFGECITCDKCKYGRDLGANDYGCRHAERKANGEPLVNKGSNQCKFAEVKE